MGPRKLLNIQETRTVVHGVPELVGSSRNEAHGNDMRSWRWLSSSIWILWLACPSYLIRYASRPISLLIWWLQTSETERTYLGSFTFVTAHSSQKTSLVSSITAEKPDQLHFDVNWPWSTTHHTEPRDHGLDNGNRYTGENLQWPPRSNLANILQTTVILKLRRQMLL